MVNQTSRNYYMDALTPTPSATPTPNKPKPKDLLAALVIRRFEDAARYKEQHTAFQGKTPLRLLNEARYQFNKQYTPELRDQIKKAFNKEPRRYFGLTQIKVNAMRAWKRDLVFANMDSIFHIFPSPNPTIDPLSQQAISDAVKRELAAKMASLNIFDPQLLLTPDGSLPPEVVTILDENLKRFRGLEEARIVAKATSSAKRIETLLQDILVESNFRQQYALFTQNQCLYGISHMKFPAYTTIPSLKHSTLRHSASVKPVYRTIPNFRAVSPFHIFPTGDGDTLQSSAGVTEVLFLSKYELLRMLKADPQPDTKIDFQAIKDILKEYETRNRNWIDLSYLVQDTETNDFWDMDDAIPALLHEGFVSGRELSEMGFSTFTDPYSYANVEVLVIAHRTVSIRILQSPQGEERSYFATPFIRTGDGVWDSIGLAAMLKDTEDRVNIILHCWENNVEWSAIPTYLLNTEAFSPTPSSISPGDVLQVNQELFSNPSTALPDPVRPIKTVSAQYELLWSAVQHLIRLADEESGIPAFAYGAANFGSSSLGEYAQRMSNALRTVKEAAAEEDANFIEPAFELMFRRLLTQNSDLVEGQDIDLQVRGITGLLSKDLQGSSAKEQMQTLIALQQAKPNLIDDNLTTYAIYNYLRNEGYPMEALGVSNPLISAAMDMAAATQSDAPPPPTTDAFETRQVPHLDGRSAGIHPATVANSDGRFNYGVGTNQYTTPTGE